MKIDTDISDILIEIIKIAAIVIVGFILIKALLQITTQT